MSAKRWTGAWNPSALRVAPAHDALEAEADRAAAQAVRPRQRTGGTSALTVRRQATRAAAGGSAAPASVQRVLQTPGRPLADAARRRLEPRFGHDFSQVRVHADAEAARSAAEIDANAYTAGRHIVFGAGRDAPESAEGERLLAHELAHVVQQSQAPAVVQRDVRGPKAGATPSDWKDKVEKATAPADRAALIGSAVAPVKVVDKTADAAGDTEVDATHCVKWDDAAPVVAYDDGLNAKKNRASDAGYTKSRGKDKAMEFFVVLGPKALDARDLTTTVRILNHEFDHVRGDRGGSTLQGDDSEVETWTSTFVREFHRSYTIRDKKDGVTSYIDPGYATFTALGQYYARSTNAKVKAAAVQKIADYYNATIKPHAINDKVFRYWLHRGINSLHIEDLCNAVNDKLGKLIDPSADAKTYQEFPTTLLKGVTFAAAPAVAVP